jgi:hypothetical protein
MTNEEIDKQVKKTFDAFELCENIKDHAIAANMAIFVILAEIAKRLPEPKEKNPEVAR